MLNLDDLILTPKPENDELSFGDLGEQLGRQQRAAQAAQIPVLIMIDGWESSGKGYTIAKIVQELEPRHYRVRVFDESTEHEASYPFLWRYWEAIPDREKIVIFDRSSYFELMNDPEIDDERYAQMLEDVMNFEKQLTDSGTLVLKYFLDISEKDQKKNIDAYMDEDYSEFLVSQRDVKQNKQYKTFKKHFERILSDSHTEHSPWSVVSMEDRKLGAKAILAHIIERMSAVTTQEARNVAPTAKRTVPDLRPLDDVTQPQPMDKESYDEKLEALQDRARELSYALYTAGLATVIAFEGIDAAGKGGTIQRLVEGMDPRGYIVHSIEAPTKEELEHHYLWRFFRRMPPKGHMAIFDRSWYGRVLVERVDELTPESDWSRAYEEINQTERHMIRSETLVLKYFLTIGQEEQEERFKAREEDPDKQHKITEDDWHNRSKWDLYMEAFNEMLVKTSTEAAPWVIVPSEDKRSARIQVLEDFVKRAQKHLKAYR